MFTAFISLVVAKHIATLWQFREVGVVLLSFNQLSVNIASAGNEQNYK